MGAMNAEDPITPAVAHVWTVMDTLPKETRDKLYALIEGAEVPRD